MTSKDEVTAKLEKFDGTEPGVYKRWRRKAELMLLALPSTVDKTKWGPKLCEFVAGEAEELIEHPSIAELCKEDGYKAVLKALDEKYLSRKQEELQKYLKEYFYKCVIKQGETFRQFGVRLETSYRHLGEHDINLPSEVRGWFLMKKMCLDTTQEALVLTASSGSLKYESIVEAVSKVMPEGKCAVAPKAKDVFLLEDGSEFQMQEAVIPNVEEETVDEVFEAIALHVQEQDGEYEDALEVFETYTDIRRKMQQQKMARGFKGGATSHLHLEGTMQGKLQQIKDRTRCFICLRPGHWKRECPKKDKSQSKGSSGGKGQKNEKTKQDGYEAMVADLESANESRVLSMDAARWKEQLEQEAFFTEEHVNQLDVMFTEAESTIRTGNQLMTALRRDLNLLDHGRPSTQRPANVNDVLLNYEEVLLVEKRRGRKEVFRHELSECHMSRLKAARRKEWNKMISSGAVRVLSVEESNHIRQNPRTRKRLLKSRFVYTKTDDEPLNEETDLKARWCVRGYLDPDLLSLDTEAPTLSADGCAVALHNIASFRWKLQICDVEGAFLRGDNMQRATGRVFIGPPPDDIEGLQSGCLIEAIKAVYGLADAPLAWYQSFRRTLLELGLRQSKFDGCVFHAYSHANHELIDVVALHVDDLCLGGNQEFEERIVAPLKKKYPFKHWHEGKGDFLGRWLEQQDNFDIHVHQKEYAKKLNGIQLDAARKKQGDMKTTDQEKKEMRAVLGAVNWLVSGSRPDLAASCSLLQQKVTQSVVADLIDVNRLVAAAHEGAETTIKIKSIKANDICFLAVSDAAWANAPSLCSQAGYMVAAVDKKIMSNCWSDFSLLRWKSYKQDRRAPSTLGAELIALSRAIAETRWIRSMWHEAVNYTIDFRKTSHGIKQLQLLQLWTTNRCMTMQSLRSTTASKTRDMQLRCWSSKMTCVHTTYNCAGLLPIRWLVIS